MRNYFDNFESGTLAMEKIRYSEYLGEKISNNGIWNKIISRKSHQLSPKNPSPKLFFYIIV